MSKMTGNSFLAGTSSGGANPFKKAGVETPYELKDTKEACYVRIDMPGCPDSDLTYWVDGNNIHFFADEPSDDSFKHKGRNYGGSLVFNPAQYNVKDAKAKLVNGVLWVTVLKHNK